MTELAGAEFTSTLTTVALSLLTPAVLAGVKFLADVRRQLDQMRTLLLGYEDKGGGLLDQLRASTAEREKVGRDLNAAWSRIRELERRAGVTHEQLTSERGAA